MLETENPSPARQIWQVSALARAIADALSSRFGAISVRGELSSFTRAASGHCYFSLKDAQSQLRCAMFRTASARLNFDPRDGDEVELRARVEVYTPRGDLQLIVESMKRAGQGSLFEQFERLKARLQAQGLFDAERKREIPERPRAIGVVTSLGAAALHDVLTAMQRRVPHIPVVLSAASVQGAQAPAELRAALQKLYLQTQQTRRLSSDLTPPIDVILLVRGGGSMEDLWAFNDEQLAHTIVQSPVPLICGVGHETDFSIADFCADLRAPTPTAAAELCATPRQALLAELTRLQTAAQQGAQRRMQQEAQRLDRLGWRVARPADSLAVQRERLARLAQRLERAPQQRLRQSYERFGPLAGVLSARIATNLVAQRHRLEHLATRLEAASFERTLARGYALVTDEGGLPITRIASLQTGQGIEVRLADGSAHALVDALQPQTQRG
jgi:exodeoxyribonuclease VII large subunit